MRFWFNSYFSSDKYFFVFQYNRHENGYGDIYFRLWRFSLLIYTSKFIGKMKTGISKHKSIKF